ncbi:MAG: METTL5 family protein [archaeon GBS-70-058]|nr:METTL5 family protein [Candidatus Culexarchaeum nevadense]
MKSLSRLRHLAMILEKVKPHPNPKVYFEQYSLRGDDAARILWFAGIINDDISGRRVLDAGCGTGILGFGAVLLGAEMVLGVDLDFEALKTALDNAKSLGLYFAISFVRADVSHLPLARRFDTVIQNPPFGVHRRGADRMFLEAAIRSARVVYSLHKYTPQNHVFLSNLISKLGGRLSGHLRFAITIPHTFDFHREFKRKVNVILYRILCV